MLKKKFVDCNEYNSKYERYCSELCIKKFTKVLVQIESIKKLAIVIANNINSAYKNCVLQCCKRSL